ncbi:MAG: hypothetical protein KDI48_14930 [Xanthomonadales bacterium]|nr:hypothetical protein [Xanthomonadales bacterium]
MRNHPARNLANNAADLVVGTGAVAVPALQGWGLLSLLLLLSVAGSVALPRQR